MFKLLLLLFPFLLFSQVGINTTTPTATLDIKGNLRVRTLNNGALSDSLVVVSNGFVKKIKNNISVASGITIGGNSTIIINQSNFVKLQGTEVLGRLFLNNQITINPSNTNIIKPDNTQPYTDWNLSGRIKPGKYNIDLEVRLFQNQLQKSSYIILRTISQTNEVFDSETFVIPESLDVGIEIPLNFSINCPEECMIQIYRVGQGLPNNIGLKWIKAR